MARTHPERVDFDDERDDLYESPRRPRLVISMLPSAATLGNLLCGFFAIYFCLREILPANAVLPDRNPEARLIDFLPTYIAIGAYLLLIAMIFDALDGQLARFARRTSEFGAQLDSIADVVSFGTAPAVLCLTMITFALPQTAEAFGPAAQWQWRITLLGALVYISCAAIRLARYNAENVKDDSDKRVFAGLPVPAAAAAIISLVILHEHVIRMESVGEISTAYWAGVIRWLVGPTVFVLGILMVSRLDYIHVFNAYVQSKHPPTHLVWLLVAAVCSWFFWEVFFVVLAGAYVLSGPLLIVLRNRRGSLEPELLQAEAPVDAN